MSIAQPTGFRATVDLLRNAQKSSKGAPLYSLYVNRPLGRIFAAVAFRAGLTPNQVTAISGCFTFASILLLALAPTSVPLGIGVAAGLIVGYALDSADGQLARLRGGGSTSGEWLDHVIDCAKISSLHLAVMIMLYRSGSLPSRALLLVPIVFSVVAAVHFFGMILNEQLARVRRARLGLDGPPPSSTPQWMSILKLPNDYGLLCLVFVLLGFPAVFLVVYSLLALANLGYLLILLPKWYRDVAALDRLVAEPTVGVR